MVYVSCLEVHKNWTKCNSLEMVVWFKDMWSAFGSAVTVRYCGFREVEKWSDISLPFLLKEQLWGEYNQSVLFSPHRLDTEICNTRPTLLICICRGADNSLNKKPVNNELRCHTKGLVWIHKMCKTTNENRVYTAQGESETAEAKAC